MWENVFWNSVPRYFMQYGRADNLGLGTKNSPASEWQKDLPILTID